MTPFHPERVQLALDMTDDGRAEELVRLLGVGGARLEVGTPLLLAVGMVEVERMRGIAPDAVLVADTKICDAGRRIADSAFAAGADIVTVVGAAADDVTWEGVVRSAADAGGRILIDAIGNAPSRSELAAWCGRALDAGVGVEVCVHRAKSDPDPVEVLIEQVRDPRMPQLRYSIAGSMTADDVPAAIAAGFSTVIVGSAVADAADPGAEWHRFLSAAGAS